MYTWLLCTLKRKLAFTFSVIIILLVSVVASFSYYRTAQMIRLDTEQYSKQILGQANLNLARYYRDNEVFFTTVASSEEFRKWLLTPAGETYSLIFLMKDIESRYIAPYSSYHPEIISVVLFNENGNENIYRSGDPNSEAILKHDYSAKRESWLSSLQLNGEVARFINKPDRYADAFGKSKDIAVMTLAQKYQLQDQTGYLIMDISLRPTNEILHTIMQGNRATAMISDENGLLIASPNSALIARPLPDSIRLPVLTNGSGHFFDPQSRNLVVYETVPGSNWKIIVQVPYDEVARSIFVVRDFTLIVSGLSLLGGLLLIFWVSDSITKRIKILKKTIKSTEMGNFDVRVQVNGVDEVAALAESYNRLLERIEDSIQKLTESKLVHQKAILSALQSQINSHFLYNALESINSMANISGHTEIRQTAVSLAKLLRYSSNYSKTMVILQDEVDSLNDYMQIITILYGDQITYHIDLQPSLEDVKCLKAMLQPIVENCIKHGYEVAGKPMTIRIRMERTDEDYVCIRIEDDGPGIDSEKLKQIQIHLKNMQPEKNFSNLDRVGLLNLHYRLKMVYADDRSGVYIPDRDMEKGIEIRILFPDIKELETS